MANTALNRTTVALLTNKSGGALVYGDVVILDNTNDKGFTTTTTAALATRGIGVIIEPNGIANNATGTVAVGGYVPKVNLNTAATAGQFLKTHTVAGQATPHSSPQVAGDFGIALTASATPEAILFGSPNMPVSGATVADADYGDITVSSSGTVWTIDAAAVTDAKISNRAAVSVFGRSANSGGVGADIAAAANDRLLARTADTVAFQQLTVGMVPDATLTAAKLTTMPRTRALTVFIGDGSNTVTTGVKGYIQCPYTGTITKAALVVSDPSFTSGSIVVDIWKDTFANRPPTVADTITASAKPTLSSATGSEDTTLTGWTTSVTAGDVFGFNVDSVTSIKQVMLQLTIVVSG